MNAALRWKEYRQQRGLWLAIALLSLVLAPVLALVIGRDAGPGVLPYQGASGVVTGLVFVLMVAHGVACGALLLAGEKEDATLAFLDTLPAERQAVWQGKLLAGALLTLTQGLLLACVGLGMRAMSWEVVLSVPLVGIDALVWGLVGGALCRNVLVAMLAGIGLTMVSWPMPLLIDSPLGLIGLKAAFALIGADISRRRFGAPDRARRQHAQMLGPQASQAPGSWHALFWLCTRQGRWVLAGTAACAVAGGLAVNLAPLALYPAGTMVIGLVCGLAVFAGEHGRQQSFFGAQRLPPGKVWALCTGFWGVAAFFLTLVLWGVAVGSLAFIDAHAGTYTGHGDYWRHKWWNGALLEPPLLLGLWVVQGFCLGQFCAFWSTRPIIAAILGSVLGAALTALWLPSVLIGGVALWQVLGVPVLLLLGTRCYQWRRLTGRLHEPRALLGLGTLSATGLVWLVGAVGYRVFEIPDVNELDLAGFSAAIPGPEKNEAGALLRRAALDFETQRDTMDAELAAKNPDGAAAPAPAGGMKPSRQHILKLHELLENGWPPDETRATWDWVDKMCAGRWYHEVQRGVRLPLGVVHDPRPLDMLGANKDEGKFNDLAIVVAARAMQLISVNKAKQALDPIETLLGLGRQLRNHAPAGLSRSGRFAESLALMAQAKWLATLRPDRPQLRRCLDLLQEHERQRPGYDQELVAAYLVASNHAERDPVAGLGIDPNAANRPIWRWAREVPWERARQERLGRLVYAAWLREVRMPHWQAEAARRDVRAANGTYDSWGHIAAMHGLPPVDGPGADWSASRWGRILAQSWAANLRGFFFNARFDTALRAQIQTTALVLYQVERDQLPARLEDLVPGYLAALPRDPFSGKPFHYRISKGETIELRRVSAEEPKELTLTPGQALLWSEGKDTPISWARSPADWYLFPVPVRADR